MSVYLTSNSNERMVGIVAIIPLRLPSIALSIAFCKIITLKLKIKFASSSYSIVIPVSPRGLILIGS